MTVTDLQKRIAEVLGVSSSEKELAFNILITKVAENLESDLTLKVPRIGFFQLKENDTNVKETLIYTPFSEEMGKNSRILYLTIDIPQKIFRNTESDSDVFSISVGKPLLPLSSDLNPQSETETSYIILRRSIEERVSEIIAESDILPNFNIWDDYYESLQSENKTTESQTKLTELTSDIEFKEDIIAEDITNNLLSTEIRERDIPLEETPQTLSPTDLLEDYEIPEKKETIEKSSPNENIEEITIDLTKKETEPLKTTQELKNLLEDYEKEKISELDYTKLKSIYEDTKDEEDELSKNSYLDIEENEDEIQENEYLGLKKTVEENIEWNWGDELKEELSPLIEEENKPLFDLEDDEVEDESFDSDEIFKSTRPVKSHLFEQLEDTIKKELSETQRRPDYFEYTPPPKYEFVEDTRNNPPPPNCPLTNIPKSTDEQYYNELTDERDRYFSKNFFMIFAAFVVIVSIIIYMLLPNKNEPSNSVTQSVLPTDTGQTEQLEASLPNDSVRNLPDEESDFPRVPSIPVADKDSKPIAASKEKVKSEPIKTRTKETSSLYNTPASDTRVGKTIFFDGTNYNVQVSSWRNKEKAEQEVTRLRGLGLNAFIFEAYLPQKGGTWYRVRVGNFKTREEAEYFQSKNSL